jgi:threonine synthase
MTSLTYLYRGMETLVYHLNRADLTAAFLESIRSSIDAERVTLTIAPETHVNKPLTLEQIIEANRRSDHNYSIQSDEFSAMVSAFEKQIKRSEP